MDFTEDKAAWDKLAQIDPWWAVLSDPTKRGGKWDRKEFYRTGRILVDGWIERLASLGVPKGRDRVLDSGCGPGRNTHALREYFREAVGYDISPTMLDLARVDAADNETFVLNETDDLEPFDNASFDLVFSQITLQHITPERLGPYFADVREVLRPDGAFAFQFISHPTGQPGERESDPDPGWGVHYEVHPIRVDAMVEMLIHSGFTPLAVHRAPVAGQSFYSYDYVAVP